MRKPLAGGMEAGRRGKGNSALGILCGKTGRNCPDGQFAIGETSRRWKLNPNPMKPSVFSAAMALIVAGCLSASAGSLLYEFTGGSPAPTLLDPPAGVTASAFSIGTGLGSMSDNGGGPDS